MVQSYYASVERSTPEQLQAGISLVSRSSVMNTLLKVANGLLAILDENRQVLAVNEIMLSSLGIDDVNQILGFRPGDVFHCVFADHEPNGCGTTEYCRTCGAAIAIVTCLKNNEPVERTCSLRTCTSASGEERDLFLHVRASPFEVDGHRLVLLFMQDISRQQYWAALERVFFHDLNNTITALIGASELVRLDLSAEDPSYPMAETVCNLARRLAREVTFQRILTQTEVGRYEFMPQKVLLEQLVEDMKQTFSAHASSKHKHLVFRDYDAWKHLAVETDYTILVKILGNLVLNAFEATRPGGEVHVWMEQKDGVTFSVWNESAIPPDIAKRVFQRNFSTKGEMGRGLGTYSVKLFTEQFLRGKISFETSSNAGTTFRIILPQDISY